ncbi:MAG TPA: hypothetical protein PLV25_05620, partial [Opitutales bacterium]|nr:hypothetical protein [Opitutales bacterium]
MAASPRGTWLMGTSEQGRVFEVQDAQSWSLLQQATNGGEVCELLPDVKHPGCVYVMTSNPGCIYRLAASVAGHGTFTSASYDAEQVARFGSFSSLSVPVSTSLVASWETRTGNTPDADETWAAWKPLSGTGKVDSPVGRFLQYRLTLKDPKAEVYQARFFYDYTNVVPVIHVLRLLPFGVQVFPNPPNPLLPIEFKSLVQNSPDDIIAELSAKMRPQLRITPDDGWITAVWAAEDYNEDPLLYTVKIRPIGSPTWMVLVDQLDIPLYSFNTNGLQEG